MKEKILIVGLGNPGKKYEKTRHNIGHRSLSRGEIGSRLLEEIIPDSKDFSYSKKFEAEILENEGVIFLKPETYMNLSGKSVQNCANFYKVSSKNIWVISDDIDLPLGTMRIRRGGSSGGHKGLQSIIESLGTDDFYRFRLGIGNELKERIPTESFVISNFSIQEEDILNKILDLCLEEIIKSLKVGVPETKTIKIN